MESVKNLYVGELVDAVAEVAEKFFKSDDGQFLLTGLGALGEEHPDLTPRISIQLQIGGPDPQAGSFEFSSGKEWTAEEGFSPAETLEGFGSLPSEDDPSLSLEIEDVQMHREADRIAFCEAFDATCAILGDQAFAEEDDLTEEERVFCEIYDDVYSETREALEAVAA